MGIPFFFSWLKRKYPSSCSVKKEEESIDILCIDYNAIIYTQIKDIEEKYGEGLKREEDRKKFEKELIEYVLEYTDLIIKQINPKKVFLALDGVCPRSKMIQQRYRRYMSFHNKDSKEKLWDTNAITPGTEFMKTLNFMLHEHYKEEKVSVIISDSSEPGEGEQKIIKYLHGEKNVNIMMMGVDADLILLSMRLAIDNQVYILRDREGSPLYVNINRLMRNLTLSITNNGQINQNIINDLIFVFTLLGNDFVPEIKILNDGFSLDCQNLVDAYKNYYEKRRGYLVSKNSTFNLKNIKYFFELLYPLEKKKTDEYSMHKYYNYYGIYQKREVVREYFKGLSWVMNYYMDNRSCPSWSWYYSYKIAPYIRDIIIHFPDKEDYDWYRDEPLMELHQLLLVLPPQSIDLVPNKYLISLTKTELKENYPYSITHSIYDKHKPHWCQKPFLPDINISLIKELVKLYSV